jgi:hypothetical protein
VPAFVAFWRRRAFLGVGFVRGCLLVKEREVRRVIRAATLEGLTVDRIDVSDGRASIVTSHGNGKQEAGNGKEESAPEVNEWDKAIGKSSVKIRS